MRSKIYFPEQWDDVGIVPYSIACKDDAYIDSSPTFAVFLLV